MYTTLGELRSDLYKLARSASSNAIAGTTEVDRAINNAIISLYSNYPWPWRQSLVTIQTVAPYSTGTITLTASSRSVTGSGTSWTTGWTGMWLKVDGESEWYRVRTISSTTALIFDQPYIGANAGSGKSYKLYKRLYTLPSMVDRITDDLGFPANTWTLEYKAKGAFDRQYINHAEGVMYHYTRWTSDYITRTYTTGTVAGTSSTATLTGTSTSWLGNVFEGDELEISSTKYTVLTVDSDTQITLAQNLQTSPSGTSYTARSVQAIAIEFGHLPDDEYNIEIPCLKRLYKVIDANDILPVPPELTEIIRYKACSEILAIHDSAKSDKYEALADKKLQEKLTELSLSTESQISSERE